MRVKKFIRRAIWTVIALATLIVLFYVEEDWRGARAWQAVLQQMHDAGEPMTLRELIPPGSPRADLSRTSIFADKNPGLAKIFLPRNGAPPRLGSIAPLREIDLGAWQRYFRSQSDFSLPQQPDTPAADVLNALKKFDPLFAQADSALTIPGAYLPIDYNGGFSFLSLEPITAQINVARVVQLRGIADIATGRNEAARDDFLFVCRLAEPSRRRGTLVDLLVNIADDSLALPILWEGLHRHAWTDTDLVAMEGALQAHDFVSDFHRSLRVERLIAFQSNAAVVKGQLSRDPWPSGWLYQNFALFGRVYPPLIAAIHPQSGTIDAAAFAPPDNRLPLTMTALLANLGPIRSAAQKSAQGETYRRMACVACELERYHLVHHAYPDQLSALTDLSPMLEREVINRQPFHYRNLGATYQLYSTGWDGKDDGGRYDAADSSRGGWPWPWPGP